MTQRAPLGVILAGGLSRRMGGGDKALLNLGAKPLLAHVIERLSPQVDDLVLNANGDPARFSEFNTPVVADTVPDFAGPLAGVLAGLDAAAERGASQIVTVAADTPFFPADLVPRLQLACEGMSVPLALAATDGLHPTFGLWSTDLRAPLRNALEGGTRKVIVFAQAHNAQTATFPAEPFDPFFNVNRPEDLQAAEARLA
ncbi:MAG: molybdenum cofactor guanylyltransferase MobA [Pseudomonadota bacterium]